MSALVFSSYPLADEQKKWLRTNLASEFETTNIFDLKQRKPAHAIAMLLRMRTETLYLLLDDPSNLPVLNVLQALAFFIRFKSSKVLFFDGSEKPNSRLRSLGALIRLFSHSFALFWAFRRLQPEIERYLQLKPERFPEGEGAILYLKTNLWFGVKAGGSVGHVAGVVNGFQNLGRTVSFASIEAPHMIDGNCEFIQVPADNQLGYPPELNNFRLHQIFCKILSARLSKMKISFIYQRLSLGNFAGVVLSRLFRKPLVLEYNGSEVWAARHWGKILPAESWFQKTEDICLKHAQLIVTVSDVLKDELIARGFDKDRIASYPNCVDPKIFNPENYPLAERAALREQLGLSPDATVVMFWEPSASGMASLFWPR